VFRRGYRHGERLLRPALVAVAEPAAGGGPAHAAVEDDPAPAGPSDLPGDGHRDELA